MKDENICGNCKKLIPEALTTCPNCGTKQNTGSLKNALIIFGILGVFVIIGLVMSSKGDNTTSQNNSSISKVQNQSAKWNINEVDAMVNGNVPMAASLLKTPADTKARAIEAIPSEVIKAPENFYGKIIKFTGSVALLSDYAAGSEFSKIFNGAKSSEIAIYANDGTVVDMFVGIPRDDLKMGQNVTIYGYPVGRTVIQNNNGQKTTRLMVVGNAFDK